MTAIETNNQEVKFSVGAICEEVKWLHDGMQEHNINNFFAIDAFQKIIVNILDACKVNDEETVMLFTQLSDGSLDTDNIPNYSERLCINWTGKKGAKVNIVAIPDQNSLTLELARFVDGYVTEIGLYVNLEGDGKYVLVDKREKIRQGELRI